MNCRVISDQSLYITKPNSQVFACLAFANQTDAMGDSDIEKIRRSNLKRWAENNSIPEKEKSYFSQLINGKTSFGEKAARRLENEYSMGGFFLDKANSKEIINTGSKTVRIPSFIAKGSMGEGIEQQDHDTITGELQLSESWAKENLKGVSSYKNIAVITGKGDSMETTFHDGDVLFVDTGIKNFVTNGVYVFSVNHNLFIKRLSRKLDGEIIATCDNPAMQHLIERPGEHGYVIHGKVVGVWNWKKV